MRKQRRHIILHLLFQQRRPKKSNIDVSWVCKILQSCFDALLRDIFSCRTNRDRCQRCCFVEYQTCTPGGRGQLVKSTVCMRVAIVTSRRKKRAAFRCVWGEFITRQMSLLLQFLFTVFKHLGTEQH